MKLTPMESMPWSRNQRATSAGRRLVERAQHLAAKIQPLGYLSYPVEGNDAFRLDPEVGVAVPAWHRLACDLQHVAEALRW